MLTNFPGVPIPYSGRVDWLVTPLDNTTQPWSR